MQPQYVSYVNFLILFCLVSSLHAQNTHFFASDHSTSQGFQFAKGVSPIFFPATSRISIQGVQDWQKVRVCKNDEGPDSLDVQHEVTVSVSSIDPIRAKEQALILLKRKAAYQGDSHLYIQSESLYRKMLNPSANGTFYFVSIRGMAFSRL